MKAHTNGRVAAATLVTTAVKRGVARETAMLLIKQHNVRTFMHLAAVLRRVGPDGAVRHNYRTRERIKIGDRGYRYTAKWVASLKALDGIALHPYFLPKLKAHAAKQGVKITAKMSSAAIAKAICNTI